MKLHTDKFVTFDRIMFKIPLEYLEDMSNVSFLGTMTPSGIYINKIYKQTHPYSMWIKVDYSKNEVIINVSAKCLQGDYSKLISKQTFSKLVDNINDTGIIKINSSDIIYNSEVLSCDVTDDRAETLTKQKISSLQLAMKSNIWKAQPYQTGILFEKKKMSLTIYDKQKEIVKYKHKYDENFFDVSQLILSFNGKIRYELKLNSVEIVKRYICNEKVESLSLYHLLYSVKDPIEEVISQIFHKDFKTLSDEFDKKLTIAKQAEIRPINYYKNQLFCKEFDYDIDKIRIALKELTSTKSNISGLLGPYKNIICTYNDAKSLD